MSSVMSAMVAGYLSTEAHFRDLGSLLGLFMWNTPPDMYADAGHRRCYRIHVSIRPRRANESRVGRTLQGDNGAN